MGTYDDGLEAVDIAVTVYAMPPACFWLAGTFSFNGG